MQIIKISPEILLNLKGCKTQNIYTNKNPIVRWLFWERPKTVLRAIEKKNFGENTKILDFGCGEGSFIPTQTKYFKNVDAFDLDIQEAKKLCAHLAIKNVKLYTDLKQISKKKYDVIVALDVLEHIKNIDLITNKLLEMLNKKGLIFITGPSENFIYKIGRKIFRFTKPPDHFYSITEIENKLKNKAILVEKRFIPIPMLFSLNPFTMLVFKKLENKLCKKI